MEFKTKFNKGDHAWYMNKNKPREVIIEAIEIFYVATDQDYIKYNASDVLNPVTWLDHANLYEDMLFKTKEDLLNSL